MTRKEKLDYLKRHYLFAVKYQTSSNKDEIMANWKKFILKHTPSKLYKYRTCDEKHINALRDRKVFFSEPSKRNDQIDVTAIISLNKDEKYIDKICDNYYIYFAYTIFNKCLEAAEQDNMPIELEEFINTFKSFRFQKKLNEAKIISYLTPFVSKRQAKKITREVKEIFLDTLKMKFRTDMKLKLNNFCKLNNLRDNCILYCLSETYDNEHQWAMYTNQGKGFCVGYKIHEITHETLLRDLLPIYYGKKQEINIYKIENEYLYFLVNKKFQFDISNGELQKFFISLYTKNPEREGEQERRFCLPKSTTNEQLIDFDYAESIYLGQNIDSESKEKLLEIAKQQNLKVYQRKLLNKSVWQYKEVKIR